MNEERKMILEMVRDGAISVEEAEKLIEAIPTASEADSSDSSAFTPKRIYVLVEENGRAKVNIRIPFSIVKVALKLGQTFGALGMKYTESSQEQAQALELLRSIDIDELIESIGEGDITLPYVVVDVEEPERGEHTRVVIE